MFAQSITPEVLSQSVIAVPPLARDTHGNVAIEPNRAIVRHLEAGGVTSILYGGNANFYHIRLSEYASTLEMLTQIAGQDSWIIPSVGPAFGLMMDQAEVLKDFDFPTAMILPQKEITTPDGIATATRRFAEALGKPVVLYLKHDQILPPKLIRQLQDDQLLAAIKYAVVRDNPAEDLYLQSLVQELDRSIIVSGIGEQPAIVHLRDFGVRGFTSGCVCIAPALSMKMLQAIQANDFETAEHIRQTFQELEDLRNGINPIRVLHEAVRLAGIADTGSLSPMLSGISADDSILVKAAAQKLLLFAE
ncbi:MAG: dihydrodipicolinate synthase family protein [Planctomycetales bacterium]|nr:dihydrodipicolinate synthase family protein [Planctomycetales bacterium]